MKFIFSTLLFLVVGSLGLAVGATPLALKDDVILVREPIVDPCPPHVVCAEPSEE
jgi:hypothetical protein